MIIMLTALLVHTVALSLWLSKQESVQKQANFKDQELKEKNYSPTAIQSKYLNAKDSVKLVQPLLTNSFSTKFK